MKSQVKRSIAILLAFCFLLSLISAAVSGKESLKIDEKKTDKVVENIGNKKKGYSTDIEKATLENNNFRKVLYSGKYSQLVLMSLKPGEEIGMEVHPDGDQFFRFEEGQGKCIINGNEYKVGKGYAVVVPAGAKHNIINTLKTRSLKLYTIYSPPHHEDQIVRSTKQEAEAHPAEFNGVTTE